MLLFPYLVLWVFQSWPDHAYLNKLDQLFPTDVNPHAKKINFTPQPVFSWPNHFYLNRLDQFVAYWSLSTLKKNRFHTTTRFHNSLKNFQYLLMKTIWFSQINLSTSLLNRFRDIRLLKISKNAAIWLAKSILNDNLKTRHFPEVQYSHDHKEDYGSAL